MRVATRRDETRRLTANSAARASYDGYHGWFDRYVAVGDVLTAIPNGKRFWVNLDSVLLMF